MIEIKDLKVKVWEKSILKWVNMKFKLWKNYCLLGKNWSWKSTLSSVLAWSPKYEVKEGNISIDWENLLDMEVDERSKNWIFLSFQNIPEIPWIKLWEFLRTIYNIHLKNKDEKAPDISPFIFKRYIKKYLEELKIDEEFLDRDLNVWFSGWEKRKIEILQMKLIWPSYIILDEIDSWLDLDAFKKVCKMLKKLDSENNTFIIITHYFKILDYLDIDKVFILEAGKVVKKWWKKLVDEVKENGYESE